METRGNSKLKIAIIHPDLGIGGAERLIVDAAVELASHGHNVHVFTAHHDKNRCFEETVAGTFPVTVYGAFLPRHIFYRLHAVCAYLRCIFVALCVLFLWPSFDVIVADQVSVVVPLLKLKRSTKVVFYCHFPNLLLAQHTTVLRSLYRRPIDFIEEITTGMADMILVNSKFTASTFANTFKHLHARGVRPAVLHTNSIDELKQKLLCTTIELEALKVEANEEMRRHKDDVKQLINLVQIAYQERDKARDQPQKLILKIMPSSPTQLRQILAQAQPGRSFVIPAKANSSITESNSLSDTYNHPSHGSSPVDSFFDAVTSPDFPSINMADLSPMGFGNKTFVQDCIEHVPSSLASPVVAKMDPADSIIDGLVKGKVLPPKGKLLQSVMDSGPLLQTLILMGQLPRWRSPPQLVPSSSASPVVAKMDPADSMINGLVKGKVLPPKGKLLQSVMDSGPLLQTLILTGQLPRWRNPPQLQPFQIPLVSITGCETANHTCQETDANPSYIP